MGLKGKIEAIIYAAEEPVSLDHIALLVKEPALQEIADERAREEAAQAAAESEAQSSSAAPEQAEVSENAPAAQATAAEGVEPQPEQLPAAPAPEQTDETPVQNASESAETPGAEQSESAATEAAPEPSTPSIGSVANPDERSYSPAPEPANSATTPEQPLPEASEKAKSTVASKRRAKPDIPSEVRAKVRATLEELIADYTNPDRGMEIRQIAGGYRMTTKPEHHDVVKAFAKSLKPPLRLSLPALETLAVIAYKQPVTAPEVGEIRGVDSQGVIATLLDRKLITTAGRKAVIGRPILYKTTKEFLVRFGLNEISELPSMEEFEKLAQEAGQVDMFQSEEERGPAAASVDGIEPAEPEDESPAGESLDNEGTGAADAADSAAQPEQDRTEQSETAQSLDVDTQAEASTGIVESEQAKSEEPVH